MDVIRCFPIDLRLDIPQLKVRFDDFICAGAGKGQVV
jgi:hypothetical protein